MKQRKWRVLLSMVLAFCLCLSAVVPVSAAGVGGTDDGSGFGDWLSDMFGGWFGEEDEDQTQDDSLTTYAGDTDSFYRIVHLDCGREYFSKDWIVALINEMAAAGYNQLQLAFGNGGFRFYLDDMTVGNHKSDDVKAAIEAGNKHYNTYGDDENGPNNSEWISYNPTTNALTETEMTEIIAHAKSKGIEIVPMFNTPGHMHALIAAMSELKISGTLSVSKGCLNLGNEDAVNFTKTLLEKYVKYFSEQNCNYFHLATDEYHDANGNANFTSDFYNYANALVDIVVSYKMTPRVFNDSFKTSGSTIKKDSTYPTQVCYWYTGTNGKSASSIANDYQMINTNHDWYYVSTNEDWNLNREGYTFVGDYDETEWIRKAQNFSNTYFYGSNVTNPAGSMFCIWCNTPGKNDETEIAKQIRMILRVIGARMQNSTTYSDSNVLVNGGFKADGTINISKPSISAGSDVTKDADGTYKVLTNREFTLSVSDNKTATWTVDKDDVVALTAVNTVAANSENDIAVYSDGIKANAVTVAALKAGTATITATLDDGTKLTAKVAVEKPDEKDITLKVGEAATVTVDGNVSDDVGEYDTNVATITSTHESIPGENKLSLGALQPYKDTYNKSYTGVIADNPASGDRNYLVVNSNETFSNTTDINKATSFTVETDYYGKTYIRYGSNNQYLYINNNGVLTVSTTKTSIGVGNSSDFYYQNSSGYYYISYINQSWASFRQSQVESSTNGWKSNGMLYNVTKTTTAPVDKTTITFTGVTPGTTSVTIGGVKYNIKVNKIERDIVLPLTINETRDLKDYLEKSQDDWDFSYSIRSNDGSIALTSSTVEAEAEGFAEVVVSAKKNGVEVAKYTFTINVAKEDLTKKTIDIELWITDGGVVPTGWTTGSPVGFVHNDQANKTSGNYTDKAYRTVNAGQYGFYSETGALVTDILNGTFTGKASNRDYKVGVDVTYWKTAYHDGTAEHPRQEWDGWTNHVNDGIEFKYLRYWNGKWAYSVDRKTWTDIDSEIGASETNEGGKAQINIFYRQVTKVTDEVTTEIVDWGPSSSESELKNTTYQNLDFAVKYESGEITPSKYPTVGKSIAFNQASSSSNATYWWTDENKKDYRIVYGILGRDTSDYEVYMITLTPNETTQSTGSYTYDDANEKVIWAIDEASVPSDKVLYEDDAFYGSCKFGGEAYVEKVKILHTYSLRVTYYVRARQTDDSLTVHYIDETDNNKEFYSYNIAVKSGTYFGQNINLPETKIDGITSLTDGKVINKHDAAQYVSSDLSTMPEIGAKYRYVEYECVRVERRDDKNVYLYYTFKNSVTFVADFGLPIEITRESINARLAGTDVTITDITSTNPKYGKITIDGNVVTYTPDKTIDGRDEFSLTYTGNIPKGDTIQKGDVAYVITILPASNVYYEEDFFTIPEDSESRWQKVGVSTNKNQAAERLGNATNNYGYDDACASDKTYSGGTALKATLTLGMDPIDRPVAKFQFTGTGFDIVSECSNTSGMLYVRVSDTDNKTEKLYLIDTYLNGDYEGEEDQKTIKNGSTTHQIPVVRCNGVLPYGTHNVSVAGVIIPESGAASVATLGMDDFSMGTTDSIYSLLEELGVTDEEMMNIEFIYMDENSVLNGGTGAGTLSNDSVFNTVSTYASNTQEYYVTIDGFRIYNPLGYEDMDADKKLTKSTYDKDEAKLEYVPVYKRLVDETLNDDSVVYMETETDKSTGNVATDITAYRKLGPYNEIYLKKGSFIAINLGKTTATSVQISAKMLNENADVKDPFVTMLKYSDGGRKEFDSQTIRTSTEMYYDVNVVDVEGTKYIIIGNSENSTGMLSISELKIPADAALVPATDAEKAYIAEAIATMLSAPIDPVDPEPEEPDTFEPDYLYAYTLPVTFRRVGATITVTSSTESGMEVYIKAGENGKVEKLDPINTRMVRWGIADKYIYSFNTGRLNRGEYTYYVYAVMDGVMSEPIPVSFVVW